MDMPTREQAMALLQNYNKEEFHLRHALTVEGVMRWYANDLGFGEDADFWAMCGLLHDIDYEMWPEEHCKKAPELLAEIDAPDDMVHAICSHGYGIVSDVEPTHLMEKVLFAADELTGLIWSAALMRPSKSCKDQRFAAGCDRDIIRTGCERLGWEMDELMEKTILAMRECEDEVNAFAR